MQVFLILRSQSRFNSIKVRLKGFLSVYKSYANRFQFHKGAIKRMAVNSTSPVTVTGFNSIKVRLKVENARSRAIAEKRFNSIKVRLKERHTITKRHKKLKFQFHKGAIKSSFFTGA